MAFFHQVCHHNRRSILFYPWLESVLLSGKFLIFVSKFLIFLVFIQLFLFVMLRVERELILSERFMIYENS